MATKKLLWHGCPLTAPSQILTAYENLGAEEGRLFTKSFWASKPDGTWTMDMAKWATRVNMPGPGNCPRPVLFPADYSGVACLDAESPFWNPFRIPNSTDDIEAGEQMLSYAELVIRTRWMRPLCQVAGYGWAYPIEDSYPERWPMMHALYQLFDVATMPVYQRDPEDWDPERDKRIYTERIEASRRLNPDIPLYLWVWRKQLGGGLIPAERYEPWLRYFARLADGLWIYSGTSSDWTRDLAFAQAASEALHR